MSKQKYLLLFPRRKEIFQDKWIASQLTNLYNILELEGTLKINFSN